MCLCKSAFWTLSVRKWLKAAVVIFLRMSLLKDFMHTMSFRWWIKNQKEQVLGWCPMWCPNIMNMGLYEDAWDCAINCSSIMIRSGFLIWGLYYREINPANGSMLGVCITNMLKTPLVSATTSGCKGRRIISDTEVWLDGFFLLQVTLHDWVETDLGEAFKQTEHFFKTCKWLHTSYAWHLAYSKGHDTLCGCSRIQFRSILERLTLLRESMLKKVCE